MPPQTGVSALSKRNTYYAHFIGKANQARDVAVDVKSVSVDGQIVDA